MSFTERKLANCRLKESNDVGNFGRGMTSSEHLTLNSGFGGGIRGRVWDEMKRGMLELPISHPSRFLDSRACLLAFHVPSILILINNLKLMNFIRWLNLLDILSRFSQSRFSLLWARWSSGGAEEKGFKGTSNTALKPWVKKKKDAREKYFC